MDDRVVIEIAGHIGEEVRNSEGGLGVKEMLLKGTEGGRNIDKCGSLQAGEDTEEYHQGGDDQGHPIRPSFLVNGHF